MFVILIAGEVSVFKSFWKQHILSHCDRGQRMQHTSSTHAETVSSLSVGILIGALFWLYVKSKSNLKSPPNSQHDILLPLWLGQLLVCPWLMKMCSYPSCKILSPHKCNSSNMGKYYVCCLTAYILKWPLTFNLYDPAGFPSSLLHVAMIPAWCVVQKRINDLYSDSSNSNLMRCNQKTNEMEMSNW